jgi:hypothetical protein
MQAHKWGIKSFYYSLISKSGSKSVDEPEQPLQQSIEVEDDSDCDSCKL